MKDKYSVFVQSQDIDQTDQIEKKFNENNFDLPEKINVIVESSKQGKQLRTSKRLTKYFTRELSTSPNGAKIHYFSQMQKRIYNSLLRDFKETNCFEDATIEGEFVNPIGHYRHESINLRFRLQERPIFSQFLTFNADKRSQSVGVLYRPIFTNMFGQCEFLSFSVSRNLPLFDYYSTKRESASLLLPYASPDLGVQEYKLTHTTRSVLKDLDQINYRAQLNFVPKTKNQDNKWKFSVYSIAHHYKHSVNSDNLIAQPNNILDQTQNVYQNVILKARYMKDISQNSQRTSNVIKIKGRIGYGSNGSAFSKLDLKSHFEKLTPFEFADRAFTGVVENKFVAKGLISANDLVNFNVISSARDEISKPVASHEKYLLANEPSFKNIDLRDKSINSSTIGSSFYATNQTKLYLPEFPFLRKINVTPFLNFYTAFVPTDLKTQGPNKLNQLIQKNLRASAGIGLSYRMNSESFKVDFIYSFGQLFAKPENDEFARFQLSFYE